MPEPAQRFGGALGRFHRLASGLAGAVAPRDAPARKRLSALYGHLLYALSGGRGVAAEINGEPFRLDPRFRWFLQPHYEEDLVHFLRPRMHAGQCCLDIGAHVGIYALQMARWTAPTGRVIAFEPNPGTATVLRRHVRMNGFDHAVRVEQLALGRVPATMALFGEAGSGLSRLGSPNPVDPGAPRTPAVSVLTVDAYCTANDVEPDWMLIDVEGFEFDVLAGAAGTIGRRGRALSIVMEIHPALWPLTSWTRSDVDALFRSVGRRPTALVGQRDPLGDYGSILLEPTD